MAQQTEGDPERTDAELLDLARRADRDASFWSCNYGRTGWLAQLLARAIRALLRRPS